MYAKARTTKSGIRRRTRWRGSGNDGNYIFLATKERCLTGEHNHALPIDCKTQKPPTEMKISYRLNSARATRTVHTPLPQPHTS